MLDDKFRADLDALVTTFLEGGGSREVALQALDDLGDELWQQDLEAGWPTDDESDAED